MNLDKYRVTEGDNNTMLHIFGCRSEQYETPTAIVEFKHVPVEEVTGQDLLHILKIPGVDIVEISLE